MAAVVVAVLFLMIPEFVVALFFTALTILFGWIPSATRLIGGFRASLGGVALLTLAMVSMIAGTHAFLRWLFRHWRDDQNAPRGAQWRWKWTLSGYGMIACSLLAISGAILTTHQIYWLSKSTDPLFADPFRERFAVQRLAMSLKSEGDASRWDISELRKSLLKESYQDLASDAFDPVWIEKEDHSIQAVILIPRHPLLRSSAKVAVLRPGTNEAMYALDELPNVLRSFGISTGKPGKPWR